MTLQAIEGSTAADLPTAIARFDLPGHRSTILEAPPDERRWLDLIVRTRQQRLFGHLMAAIEAKALPVTAQQEEAARELHLGACLGAIRLEKRLLEVAGALDDAAVEMVALKGSAIAHLAYPDPSRRFFGDVDILVRGRDLRRAIQALGDECGAKRPVPEFHRGFDSRFAKSVTLICADHLELDVHRNLVFGSFGFLIDSEELFSTTQPVHIAGRSLRALGPEQLLLHAFYHASLGDPVPRLSSIRDIAQLMGTGDHDRRGFADLTDRWKAWAVVKRGIRLCTEVLGVEMAGSIVDAAASYKPSKVEQRAISSYVGPRRSHTTKVLAAMPFLPSPAARFGFLAAALVPSRAFCRSQTRSESTSTLGRRGRGSSRRRP